VARVVNDYARKGGLLKEDDRAFDMLMGNTVGPSKRFIQAHATAISSPLGEASRREGREEFRYFDSV
jgi:hypothetical protein